MTETTNYLTSEELAEYLRYDNMDAFWSARRRGQLPPAIRRGNRLLWAKKTVDAWLEARQEQPA